MGSKTCIEWTDCTDNIIVVKGGGWWCRKVSPGCAHCYAAELNQSSYFGGNKLAYTGEPPELLLRREMMAGWARQTKARKHFVASMTDVFGEWVPPEWAFEILDAMTAAPRQTFQVLTKRPAVAREYIVAWLSGSGMSRLPDNIWIGATVEDQTRANERIPELLRIPAAVRFLSCEPLLGPVDLGAAKALPVYRMAEGSIPVYCGASGRLLSREDGGRWRRHSGNMQPWVDWVIAGGESGKQARPMHPEWVRGLRDQCQGAGVPFFFKQWGEWRHCDEMPGYDYAEAIMLNKPHQAGEGNGWLRLGKKRAGRVLDGDEWSEFPAVGGGAR